jgi:hypothetical protein
MIGVDFFERLAQIISSQPLAVTNIHVRCYFYFPVPINFVEIDGVRFISQYSKDAEQAANRAREVTTIALKITAILNAIYRSVAGFIGIRDGIIVS